MIAIRGLCTVALVAALATPVAAQEVVVMGGLEDTISYLLLS